MGGFTLVYRDRKDVAPKERNGAVLTIKAFRENPNITLPEIIANEIQDWSKGDFLLKLIAILQISWFILQCLARRVQELALTQLELVTLTLVSVNVITFVVWWHKPLGKQNPVEVYLETDAAQQVSNICLREKKRCKRFCTL